MVAYLSRMAQRMPIQSHFAHFVQLFPLNCDESNVL